MKSSVIAAICVTLFCISGTVNKAAAAGRTRQCKEVPLYQADLKTGSGPGDIFNHDGFTIESVLGPLRPDTAPKGKCNRQGVLKITFPEAEKDVQNHMLRFDLEFDTSFVSGHAFHVGNSLTNRAIGGDDGNNDTPFIGEAFSSGPTWTVHTNDLSGHETVAAADSQEPYVVIREQNYITKYVTLFIGDEFISSDNYLSEKPLQF